MHGENPIYTYADLTRSYHERYKNGRAHSGTRTQLHYNRYIYKKIDPKTLEVVETYDSANKIRDTLNLDKSSIYHCVKKDGRYKTVGGYIWEREENPHYKEPIL